MGGSSLRLKNYQMTNFDKGCAIDAVKKKNF